MLFRRRAKQDDVPDLDVEARKLVSAYRESLGSDVWGAKPADFATGRAILEASPEMQVACLTAILTFRKWAGFPGKYRDPFALNSLKQALFARDLPFSVAELEKLLSIVQGANSYAWTGFLRPIERFVGRGNELTPAMRQSLIASRPMLDGGSSDERKLLGRIDALLGIDRSASPDAGETWADLALLDLQNLTPPERTAWGGVFAHAQASEASKPPTLWRKQGTILVAAVGGERFRAHAVRWFNAVTLPPVRVIAEQYQQDEYRTYASEGSSRNLGLLKGLAWMCADSDDPGVARALAKLVEATLKKIPGIGPWGTRAANAAVYALTEMPCPEAVAQLGRLKTKVTFGTVLKQIENGLEIAAKRAGVTKADLEDMSVPRFGFEANGVRREEFGGCAAVATISKSGEIAVEWFAKGGKPVKAPPAEVKKSFPAELKAFKSDVDSAGKMLTAQRLRFDTFYLPERVWTLAIWKERFASHPILDSVAKRLIWHLNDGERKGEGIWSDLRATFLDVNGAPIDWLTDAAEARLWHPIGFPVEQVVRWRERLQELGITQPFKQAHREVYLLTEAELRTETYSNRFAGHILKQHQMNQLAGLRGWKSKLRLMVDDFIPPPTKPLRALNLRAEFWTEGAGDEYGRDTLESGAFLYLTTDQVRFYRLDAPENTAHAGGGGYEADHWQNRGRAPSLPLVYVPALSFSEIMRDVDLFVGVASVGNDPNWQDGGRHNEYNDYWQSFSFGDLTPTAQTRRDVLERLLPRLKIASRCELRDKFLVVRGDLRTYKIHLGSGNILMEPNDQYLCIVESRGGKDHVPVNFLPFEGDQRLAVILSKAFLLADDKRITDPTIIRQISRT